MLNLTDCRDDDVVMTSELSEALPGWVFWFGPVLALAVVVSTSLWVWWVLIVGPLRGFEEIEPWTERARRVYVARAGSQASVLLLPALGILASVAFVGPLSAVGRSTAGVGLIATGLLAGLGLASGVDRRLFGGADSPVQSALGALMGLGPIVALVTLGWFAPDRLESWLMIPWLVAVLLVIHTSLRIPVLLERVGVAVPADRRLNSIVAGVSATVGTEVRQVLELRSRQPNAFAFPWLGIVLFTSRLIEILDDDEVEAIAHHELAHLKESAWMTRLRQAQLYAFVPLAALQPLLGSFGIIGPLAAIVLLLVVLIVARRRWLTAEQASDAAAIESAHHAPAYGRALEKTYRVGLIPAVLNRSTHGPLHERLRTAGVEPDFEVPSPPSRARLFVAITAVLLTFTAALFSPWLAYLAAGDGSDLPMQMSAAIPVYGTDPLASLAIDAELEERWRDAALLYEAATEMNPDDPALRTEALRLWAFAGQCERARDHVASTEPSSPEEAQYYDELIDWCDLTGGLQPTG